MDPLARDPIKEPGPQGLGREPKEGVGAGVGHSPLGSLASPPSAKGVLDLPPPPTPACFCCLISWPRPSLSPPPPPPSALGLLALLQTQMEPPSGFLSGTATVLGSGEGIRRTVKSATPLGRFLL